MIKQILQRAGVTLAQFASDLSISRPTLDSYIAAFDNGSKISNSFYQDIFDFLFEDQQMQAEEFSRRYKYMREYYGMTDAGLNAKTSKFKSGYSQPKGEYEKTLDKIIHQIEKDRISQETPYEIYTLIYYLLTNMESEFLDLVRFYIYFSGFKDATTLADESKKRYAVLYRTLKTMDQLTESIKKEEVEEFVRYATRQDESKRAKIGEVKAVMGDITRMITAKIENGDIDSADIDKVLTLFKKELGDSES